jgi:hypothetical protein
VSEYRSRRELQFSGGPERLEGLRLGRRVPGLEALIRQKVDVVR